MTFGSDLSQKMTDFANYSQLVDVWLKWREASGNRLRQTFVAYLALANKAAQLEGTRNGDSSESFSTQMPMVSLFFLNVQ